jgi:hypothetical protein
MAGTFANNGNPLGKLRGVFFTNGENRNDYPCGDESAKNAENDDLAQEKIMTGGIPGRIDHTNHNPETNPNDETLIKECAVNMRKFPRRNDKGQYIGECLIMDNPDGQKVYAYCKAGRNPGISYRGGIDEEAYNNGDVDLAWKQFTIEGFDIVLVPAYRECYLELVEDYIDPESDCYVQFKPEYLDNAAPIARTAAVRRAAGIDAQGAARAMIKIAASKQGAKAMAKVMAQEKHFSVNEALLINKAIDDANIDGNRRTKEQAEEIGTPYDASPKHTWARQKGNGTINMFDEAGIYGEDDIDPITGKKIETLNTGNKSEEDIAVLGKQTEEQKKQAEASAKRIKADKLKEKADELAEDVADAIVEEKIKEKGIKAAIEINENGDTLLPPLSANVLAQMGLEGESREVILRGRTLTEHQRTSHPEITNEQLSDIIEQAIADPDIVKPAKKENYWHLIKENIRVSSQYKGTTNHGLLRLDLTLELVEMISGYFIDDKALEKEKKTATGGLTFPPSQVQAQAAGGSDFLQFVVVSILLYANDGESQEVYAKNMKKNAGIEKGTVADREKDENEELKGYVDGNGKIVNEPTKNLSAYQIILKALNYLAEIGIAEKRGDNFVIVAGLEEYSDYSDIGSFLYDAVIGTIYEDEIFISMVGDYGNQDYGNALQTLIDNGRITVDLDRVNAARKKYTIAKAKYERNKSIAAGILGVASEEETPKEKEKSGDLDKDGEISPKKKSAIKRSEASLLGVEAEDDEPEVELLTEDGIKEIGSEIVKDESEEINTDVATLETLVAEITKLSEEIAKLREEIKGKDKEIDNRNAELKDLAANYKRLKGTVANAVDKVKAAETVLADNANLQERNKTLAKVITHIKTKHKADIDDLKAENDDYKKVIAGYEKETRIRNSVLSVQANALKRQDIDNKVLAGRNDNLGKLCIETVAEILGIDEGKLLEKRREIKNKSQLEKVIASLQKPKRTVNANYYPVTEGMRNALPNELQEICRNVDWNDEDEI